MSTLGHATFVMCLVHDLLPNFSIELRLQLTYVGRTIMGFLPVEYEEGGGGVEDFEEM